MENKFKIDLFELGFLAEVCIPQTPIARAFFWQNLTDIYYAQMTDGERNSLFTWLNRSDRYQKSLLEHKETQIFHARYNPDNQYEIHTLYKRKKRNL